MTRFETDMTGSPAGDPGGAEHGSRPDGQHGDQEGNSGGLRVCPAGHEWVVYSTALQEHWLMLQCVECGTLSTVDDPTREEWGRAFRAPSRPFRWMRDSRVTLRGQGRLRVIRATGATRCGCQAQIGRPEIGDYERYPVRYTEPLRALTEEDRGELRELADLASNSGLCSPLFPLFIRGFEEDAGLRNSPAVEEATARIERIVSHEVHFTPGVVAMILRGFAGS